MISGTLLAAGVWNVVVTVDDGLGGAATTGILLDSGWCQQFCASRRRIRASRAGSAGSWPACRSRRPTYDGDTLTYSATGSPAGLSIDSGTGLISGVYSSNGKTTTTVTVSDGKGGVASVSFVWAVRRK